MASLWHCFVFAAQKVQQKVSALQDLALREKGNFSLKAECSCSTISKTAAWSLQWRAAIKWVRQSRGGCAPPTPPCSCVCTVPVIPYGVWSCVSCAASNSWGLHSFWTAPVQPFLSHSSLCNLQWIAALNWVDNSGGAAPPCTPPLLRLHSPCHTIPCLKLCDLCSAVSYPKEFRSPWKWCARSCSLSNRTSCPTESHLRHLMIIY
jgi:hypothetical protein